MKPRRFVLKFKNRSKNNQNNKELRYDEDKVILYPIMPSDYNTSDRASLKQFEKNMLRNLEN